MNKADKIIRCVLAGVLLFGAGAAGAAMTTYDYVITGDVFVGDETDANAFGLTAGETITAYGTFTADLSGSGQVTIPFGSGSGNTMTIDLNGTLLSASQAVGFGSGNNPFITLNGDETLYDLDFLKTSVPTFNSSFLYFDDLSASSLFGQWQTSVSLTVVPVPAAVWLFGSGLLGLVAAARRKT